MYNCIFVCIFVEHFIFNLIHILSIDKLRLVHTSHTIFNVCLPSLSIIITIGISVVFLQIRMKFSGNYRKKGINGEKNWFMVYSNGSHFCSSTRLLGLWIRFSRISIRVEILLLVNILLHFNWPNNRLNQQIGKINERNGHLDGKGGQFIELKERRK